MPIKRNPSDTCLLCKKDEANFKGSHLVPQGLLNRMIGKRDYEEGYSILPTDENKPLRGFFGSANLKNQDTTQYPNEFKADYAFCTACERRFGAVENEILPYITRKFLETNQAQNFPAQDEATYKVVRGLRIPPKLLAVFFFGVAWRMSIQYWIQMGQNTFLPAAQHELIRSKLDEVMDNDLAALHQKVLAFPDWPYLLVTCRDWKNYTANVVVPSPEYTNPFCFWMAEFIFIFGFGMDVMLPFHGPTELGIDINDGRFINYQNVPPFFIDVPEKVWDRSNESILYQVVGEFQSKRLIDLSQKLKVTSGEADKRIRALADAKHKETNIGYGFCFEEAYKELMSS